jgi:hypothetical protein
MSRPISRAEIKDEVNEIWKECQKEGGRMTDFERGFEQGKVDAVQRMHLETLIRKAWVGLDDEEYQTILGQLGDGGLLAFYILIESKLKEKNT